MSNTCYDVEQYTTDNGTFYRVVEVVGADDGFIIEDEFEDRQEALKYAAELNEEADDMEEYGDGMTDVEADADTLRSCGFGTDEDYGDFDGYGGDYY
jgi:hypothetical protein